MKAPLALFAGLCLLTSQPAQAGYHEFQRESSPRGLLSLFRHQDRISAIFFHADTHRLSVLDEGPSRSYGSLRIAIETSGCTAGVNGGYFADDPASTPLGLLIHRGKQHTPLATNGFTVAGVLYDTGQGIYLERCRKLTHRLSEMDEAIQGGPFLIERGRIIRGLNNTRRAPRTFVATNGRGDWCLAVTSSMTLHELACWLADGALGPFGIRTALNLDGGSSSCLIDLPSRTSIPATKPVRNYVGIRPRDP